MSPGDACITCMHNLLSQILLCIRWWHEYQRRNPQEKGKKKAIAERYILHGYYHLNCIVTVAH